MLVMYYISVYNFKMLMNKCQTIISHFTKY